jgi:dienelactone hydrolase
MGGQTNVPGETRHITIERRARYAVIAGETGRIEQVWFALHGYNQLAPRFIRHLLPLDDGTRYLVAPEGLHRQYMDGEDRKVGASWMTSEDRLTDIADYVAYLDLLYDTTFAAGSLDRASVRVVALGFSQGVHTLCRWLALGHARIDRAVLWGGTVPPDLDLSVHGKALDSADLRLVVGSTDRYFGPGVASTHEAQLHDAGIAFRSSTFDGGHRLDGDTLLNGEYVDIPTSVRRGLLLLKVAVEVQDSNVLERLHKRPPHTAKCRIVEVRVVADVTVDAIAGVVEYPLGQPDELDIVVLQPQLPFAQRFALDAVVACCGSAVRKPPLEESVDPRSLV